MKNRYQKTMNSVKASEGFKTETLQKLENQTKRGRTNMKQSKKMVLGMAASLAILAGVFGFMPGDEPAAIDLTTRIVVDANAINACQAVNIEGTITDVSEDGMSFELDNGKWVHVTDETEIGITSPTAAAAEDQYFEPTFRVGNMIAGFTLEESGDEVIAYAIYTNWNWEDPIR
jgi:hypothetical protein